VLSPLMSSGRYTAAAGAGSVVRMLPIHHATSDELPAAAALLAHALDFGPADAVPAWFMRTTNDCGGLTLVAVDGNAVVGVSYAVSARTFLFSCGLAVAPANRGQRLGLELKLAQRREAAALGYTSIRWTAEPINGRALRVYLARLGARIVGYRPGMHDGLRADPGHAQDDLEITWDLTGSGVVRGERTVELPWSAAADGDRDRVRAEMSALLADGFVGWDVRIDRTARRCHVVFGRP
jgi:predicted GNAT superfamily acetyltransferase